MISVWYNIIKGQGEYLKRRRSRIANTWFRSIRDGLKKGVRPKVVQNKFHM